MVPKPAGQPARETCMTRRIVPLLCAAALIALPGTAALAQPRPANLEQLPPVPTDYAPPKTAWGDPDISHTYQHEFVQNTRVLFIRPTEYGNRFWQTEEEHARRVTAAERSDGNFAAASERGIGTSGTEGLAHWVKSSPFAWRTSMLVSPANGQIPEFTPKAKALHESGRSGWVPGIEYDWVSDFDSWDRCVSRGFPASMYPFRYNNGIRIFQAPGYVTIALEMLGTRVIPIRTATNGVKHSPAGVEAWLGNSVGWWEGNTLVIETINIKSGDSVSPDHHARNGSPLNIATQAVPPFNTIPTSTQAKTVERLTMTGPNAITHELTYSDPEVFTAPWTTRVEWIRDDDYAFFEYACHEGNRMPRDYISASRAKRAGIAAGTVDPNAPDDRAQWSRIFDRDPAVAPPPAPPGAPAAAPTQGSRGG
ncbi:MAG: hypothetical protein B7Z08_12360 [Sphingomonadales bacterium 32-68-7]|nr:MAG: hypothetical protein B7Z08_12360 [Sphingomonadales bacterium 32-68-7]